MLKTIRYFSLFFICIAGLTTSVSALEHKTITRLEDPVVIEGAKLKDLINTDHQQFALMHYDSGKFNPIPFQVDERHKDGKYAYKSGEKASRDENPLFDENDELVFMVNDLGDKAPANECPPGIQTGMELRVVDPLNSSYGWAYLFSFSDPPPLSAVDYVSTILSPQTNRKQFRSQDDKGNGYIMGAPMDTLCPDELRIIDSTGKYSPDLLDKLKIRGKMNPKFFFKVDFKLDHLIRSKLMAYTDGPVRVIYIGSGYFKLGIIKISGHGYEYVKAYRSMFDETITFTLPFQINTFLKEFPIQGRMDFNPNAIGYQVISSANPASAGIMLDNITSNQETNLDKGSDCGWIAGYGSLGGIVFRLSFPGDKEWSKVKRTLYLKENPDMKDEPEDHPGEMAVGMDIKGMEKLHTNKGIIHALFFILTEFKPGDETPILNIHDHPLKVECHKFKKWRN